MGVIVDGQAGSVLAMVLDGEQSPARLSTPLDFPLSEDECSFRRCIVRRSWLSVLLYWSKFTGGLLGCASFGMREIQPHPKLCGEPEFSCTYMYMYMYAYNIARTTYNVYMYMYM